MKNRAFLFLCFNDKPSYNMKEKYLNCIYKRNYPTAKELKHVVCCCRNQ